MRQLYKVTAKVDGETQTTELWERNVFEAKRYAHFWWRLRGAIQVYVRTAEKIGEQA